MKSAQDLVDRIGHPSVSESILANIETGRKADLSVSQLLNLAFALQLSPAYLLAPMGAPLRELDLPNLSEGVARLSPRELDAWISGSKQAPLQWGTVSEESERHQLAALRELDFQIRERKRLAGVIALEAEAELPGTSPEDRSLWEKTEDRLAETRLRIEQLTTYLGSAGWELESWTAE